METTTYSKKDMSMLLLALNTAKTSSCRRRHGAVLVRGGSVIGKSVNVDRNPPTLFTEDEEALKYAGICAERRLLSQVGESSRGATMYIARAMRDDTFGISKPCSRCAAALEEAGVRKVIYSV